MNVLSLFDGISCGRIALERAGITVEKYYASEINKNSIKVTMKNYPDTIQLGDVMSLNFNTLSDIDIIIGGSPCSYFSNARTTQTDKRERVPGGMGYELFTYFVNAVKTIKPKYFLYENNYSMSNEVMNKISIDLSASPIMIDSSLVSAQSRKRYYWTNIHNVSLPINKNIQIGDVIKCAVTGAALRNQLTKNGYKQTLNVRKDNKSNCLVTFATKRNCLVKMIDESVRPLTADEFEILQTLPKGYTDCLSESARKTVCALGWTVDVIAHIFRHIDESKIPIKQNMLLNKLF